MDQAKCLNICIKTKNTSMKRCTTHQSSSSSSWEYYQESTTTFAYDSNRDSIGGLPMWPPRSYSCSFCKREFRSAQALGGHMNVHRRDRALLKEMITTTTTHIDDDHDHHHLSTNNHHDHDHDHDHDHHHHHYHDHDGINPSKPTLPQYPSQVCGPRTSSVTSQHHLSLTRVSPNYHSISENRKVISNANDALFQAYDNKLSMGLNLAIGTYKKEEHQEESFQCKRSKKTINGDYDDDVNALFPFFEDVRRSNYLERGELRVPEILSIKSNKSMEELDLELRLGYPPHKVSSNQVYRRPSHHH